jgi:TRAP transporter TAXI family solute receptor
MPVILEASTNQAIRDLEKGKIDAIVLTQAVPAPSLQSLASRRKDVRFLSIPPHIIEQLTVLHSAYYPMHVAARTYPNQTQPFVTLGLSAALMTSKNVPDEKVEAMLMGLLKNSGRLARDYYRAGFITSETMRLGIAVPLHPAAERIHNKYETAAAGGRPPDTAQGVGAPR